MIHCIEALLRRPQCAPRERVIVSSPRGDAISLSEPLNSPIWLKAMQVTTVPNPVPVQISPSGKNARSEGEPIFR
jgi:hypothetical protein